MIRILNYQETQRTKCLIFTYISSSIFPFFLIVLLCLFVTKISWHTNIFVDYLYTLILISLTIIINLGAILYSYYAVCVCQEKMLARLIVIPKISIIITYLMFLIEHFNNIDLDFLIVLIASLLLMMEMTTSLFSIIGITRLQLDEDIIY